MKLSFLPSPVWLAAVASLLFLTPIQAQAPQAAPNLTPKRPSAPRTADAPDPDEDHTQPVATVNGVAVYRPLMHSIVARPTDRALLLFAYRKSGLHMSDSDKELAARQMEISQFNDSNARLDAKLKTLGATRDDYRQYAVEETKIRDVLRSITHGARSPGQARTQTVEYLAQLRRDASINTARP